MPRNGSDVYSKPAGTTAVASTTIESAKFNSVIDDLVSDQNTPRPIVAGGTGASTAGTALTALGGQPADAGLTSIAGLTTAADRMIYTTASDVYAVATLTAAGLAILDDADTTAQRATLGLTIGTDVQAYGATLTSLEALSLSAGDLLYATAADTLTRLPKGTAGQVLQMNSGATAPEWATGLSAWTFLTPQATTSGTDKDFTGIPATASEIIIYFQGNSLTTADDIWVRLGDAGGFEATGYAQVSSLFTSAGDTGTTAFAVYVGSSSGAVYGSMTLTRTDAAAFTWSQSHTTAHTTTRGAVGGGVKSLSATLTQIRVTVSAGAWDAGALVVGYR